jgi:protein O-mannosyl-transferase
MAKKQKIKQPEVVNEVQEPVAVAPPVAASKPLTIFDFKLQAIIISVLALVFYFNSFFNEYAHDDGIVIVKNEYVLEGFAGIPKILTRDAYDSYYRQLNTINQLSGGRYRPLSIVTFAIEQQFLGAIPEANVDSVLKQNISYGVRGAQEHKLVSDMHVRHIFNVLWYILSLVVLLYFLRYIVFKSQPLMAFVAAIIFTIHPIHTEVVANVKSRDEIMSLLFMCLTFIFAFRYEEDKKNKKMLLAAMVSYFLAFLSKEYAITMVALLPLSLYIFRNYSIKKSIVAVLPFLGVIAVYLFIRFQIVAPTGENAETEVLNNPYLFASASEKLATEIATSLNYLKLLIFPHPLSADYSYNSIPYKDFSSLSVWLSLLVHGGLIAAMIILFKKRSVVCFAIAFYFLHLLMICNIVFDIGATMGERLIYHSSVGFAIAVAYFLIRGMERIKPETMRLKALAAFMVIIVVLSGFKTIPRSAQWKNDGTLFEADLKVVPNSVLVCANVAASYITIADQQADERDKNEYLHKAIGLLDHALEIHPKFVAAFLNRGIAWYKLDSIDKAKMNFDAVKKLYPSYPTLPGMYKLLSDYYMKNGWNSYGKFGKYPEAVAEFRKGLALDSTNSELWYNMGGALFSNREFADAVAAWNIALKLNPAYGQAKRGLDAAMKALSDPSVPESSKVRHEQF